MLDDLIQYILKFNPDADVEKISKAFNLAYDAHQGQLRKSGEPYIIHPVAVAKILAELNMDTDTICSGLLHDVIEDTKYTHEDLKNIFGDNIADIVEGVTKIKNLNYKKQDEAQAENIRKMVLAMSNDIRVVIVKLADRLHNLRTLEYMTDEKRYRIARETLDIYAPLAHRLGISKIKWELEDLCLRHLEPEAYYDLVEKVNKKRKERENDIKKIIDKLSEKLTEAGIKFSIEGRPKSFYSIYKKMKDQNKSFDSIYDLTAVRIIVDTINDCYAALGVVHASWKPVPGRFKDYIAMPKPNMYQSLHTTVISNEGEIFEVQIRTWEMHKTSEYGIAAHWMYKVNGSKTAISSNLKWLQQLMEWQADMADPKEFIDTLKMDFFNDEVFVLTPRGDVVDLPQGSTPVDFAYRVHTDIGNRTIGAKINGKIVPLNYELQNGDIVEITTSKNICGPSRDWLKFVKSSRAKTKIKAWFKTIDKEENIESGKEILNTELKRLNIKPEDAFTKENLNILYDYFSLNELDDLYQQIGYGSLKLNVVMNKIKSLVENDKTYDFSKKGNAIASKYNTNSPTSVIVDDVPGLQVRFSRCCNPLPGDDIVGFVTKGHGVSVHRSDCPNAESLKERLNEINVRWSDTIVDSFISDIVIKATDRVGLLSEVAGYMREQKAHLINLNAKITEDSMAIISMTVKVENKAELTKIISDLRKIPSVLEAYRKIT
ncbi:MAG: bifunctional (p)ppGpp synthetase/guanosine-3',5'-bis(diphosphate) 3'-pyrophosphohydrolase [Ezakiella sp.]|nr:bifunctional (p)ppGpp synthetase/guanosine-3',5'-bis(diphosphate) 3'-pyrophosphohydrolase [Ezakiella sp.]MDD7471931.1 bifunctional (p)ppGpp synthetase/guanosine-3',5'-bis(diphosphate) 3'-pyrophosphohydrolase [Bacillota bacterium]MDY3923895.1 bifunctional (p)ppGpp synthetase/guanosine-3',5'-bis(diphosphate) 3'-pyrophosphohydrolase [Ezakiella sp.]